MTEWARRPQASDPLPAVANDGGLSICGSNKAALRGTAEDTAGGPARVNNETTVHGLAAPPPPTCKSVQFVRYAVPVVGANCPACNQNTRLVD